MKDGGAVHTVPADDGKAGWWNKRDGRVLSRHREREMAVEAGCEIARNLRVAHTIHRSDGAIAETHSYGAAPLATEDGD